MNALKSIRPKGQIRRASLGLAAVVLTLALVGWAAAETAALYLRIRSAPVRSEPSFEKGSEQTVTLAGQSFSVLERSKDNDWVKVRFAPEAKADGNGSTVEGWIHATVLSDQPLRAERDPECPWLREGAKALPEAGPGAKGHAERRRQKLDPILEVEKLYPSEKDLDTFLKDGDLGLHRKDWPSLEGGQTK